MDKTNFQLASFSPNELVELLTPILIEIVKNYFQELVSKYPHEEVFNQEQLAEFLNRSLPSTREAVLGYNIPPHVFKPEANPHYLKSEVIWAIKNSPAPQWFHERRKEFISRIELIA